jgi:hypothetical protein
VLGIPTVTVISTAFAPLAQVVSEGVGLPGLPILVVSHPVGDPDESVVKKRGADIAAECARVLTTPAGKLAREYAGKQFPLPAAVMPR